MAKAGGIEAAKALPQDGKDFADRLVVEFTDLVRVEDPTTVQLQQDNELKRGQTTLAHMYQETHQDLTLEESHAAVMANLERQGEYHDLMAKREMDPAAGSQDPNEESGAERSDPEPEPEESQ